MVNSSVVIRRWSIPFDIEWNIKGLSVDWLYKQLYVLLERQEATGSQWKIARCTLDGKYNSSLVVDIKQKVVNMEVDPFNGFLFWTIQDPIAGGLFRVDLADLKPSHPLTFSWSSEGSNKIWRILEETSSGLGAFTIDHVNYRVLMIINSSMLSVSLSGSKLSQRNISNAHSVTSMTSLYLNETLHWINNGSYVYEETNENQDSLRHNQNTYSDKHITALVLYWADSQPIPVPMAPIKKLQALFQSNVAQISWKLPPNIHAWRGNSYSIGIGAYLHLTCPFLKITCEKQGKERGRLGCTKCSSKIWTRWIRSVSRPTRPNAACRIYNRTRLTEYACSLRPAVVADLGPKTLSSVEL